MKQLLTLMLILFPASLLLMSQTGPAQGKLKESIDRGNMVYIQRCLSCHLINGTGISGVNPSLVHNKTALGATEPLVNIIVKGMPAGTEIDGVRYNNAMAPAPDMTDLQIADVLTYVRNGFGNNAKMITEAEVKSARAKLK
ncbi:MAG: cytochrome c [Bacteroidetes bacterium]|nr:cytochrome c [Bacteroidota bacterium]MBS1974679.1 cytochrome c [Bacteroidota bacterium]